MTGKLVWSSSSIIEVLEGVVLIGQVEPSGWKGQKWSFCLFAPGWYEFDSIHSEDDFDTAEEAEAALRELYHSSPKFPEAWSPFDGDEPAYANVE
jgi:hypothetical protein